MDPKLVAKWKRRSILYGTSMHDKLPRQKVKSPYRGRKAHTPGSTSATGGEYVAAWDGLRKFDDSQKWFLGRQNKTTVTPP